GWIAAKQFRSIGTAAVRARLQRPGSNYIALCVPIRGPARIVKEIRRWQTGVPTINTGKLPAADNSVDDFIGTAEERATTTEWYFPYSVHVYHVTHVKVGVSVPIALPDRIQDKSGAITHSRKSACLQTRSVVT